MVINISRNRRTSVGWKIYLLNRPLNLLLRYTFWCFSIHTLYHPFTVRYSHNQHAHVTSVRVFVNARCFKMWSSFICAISATSFDKNKHTHRTLYLGARSQDSDRSTSVLYDLTLLLKITSLRWLWKRLRFETYGAINTRVQVCSGVWNLRYPLSTFAPLNKWI